MAILTSLKDALNAKQYKSELEKLIEENKNLRYIKLTPTQLGMSQVLSKTKELQLELEEYDKLIQTKTKAIEELNREYKSQAVYQTKEFEDKSNEHDNLMVLKDKEYEDKKEEYDTLISTRSEEYENLIALKSKELQDKSEEYDEFIESKNCEYEDLNKLKEDNFKQKSAEYEQLIAIKIKSIDELNVDYNNLKTSVDSLKSEIITLDDDILMQSFGIYKTKYNLLNSIEGASMLENIREKQMNMVNSKEAIEFKQWIVNGSIKKGNDLVEDKTEDMIKLVLRIFNDECDSIIDKVKFSNIEVIENRIKMFFEDLNKLGNLTQVKIVPKYLNTKLEELYVAYEYTLKEQE